MQVTGSEEIIPQHVEERETTWSRKRVIELIAQARRRSLFRSVIISLLASAAMVTALLAINCVVLNGVSKRIALHEEAAIAHTCPNTYVGGGLSERQWGLFGGMVRFRLYRVIGHTPIRTGEQEVTFSWFGPRARYPSTCSWGPILNTGELGKPRVYDSVNLTPVLWFYHPDVEYESLPDDTARLRAASEYTAAEMALSLDRFYSVQEISSMLPGGVEARWYAVNIWSAKEQVPGYRVSQGSQRTNYPISSGLVGFPAYPGLFCYEKDDGTRFVENLKHFKEMKGRDQALFRQAHSYIQEHGVQVYGVVVTGKAPDLLKLRECPWVRAAVLGLHVDEL